MDSSRHPGMAEGNFTEHFSHPGYQQQSPVGSPTRSSTEAADSSQLEKLSDKDGQHYSYLSSPGLQSVQEDESFKEVAPSMSQHLHGRPQPMPQTWSNHGDHAQHGHEKRKVCGIPLLWVFIIIGLVVGLAVGLGAGLGVGLRRRSSHTAPTPSMTPSATPAPTNIPGNTEYLIGGAIEPAYYSTTGAFNGSGIALASQSFASNLSDAESGALVMYFQHYTGTIRWKQLSSNGSWIGGTESEIVASNAKNGTPLSAVAYAVDGADQWHIFYISTDGYLQQRSNSNTTNFWDDGLINNANLRVFNADQVGMQGCWYGSDYGDPAYDHSPVPGAGNASSLSSNYGMNMWYASDDTTFQQYGWRYGEPEWTFVQTWENKNGHAGVGCYSWAPSSSITYVMFANTQNTVEIWWRDGDLNHTNTTTHPTDVWTNSSIAINNADPSTSLGYTNYFYWQDATSHYINGVNITWAAENTSWTGGDFDTSNFQVAGEAGLPGTHLSVSTLPNTGGGNTLTVFFQTLGNDITEFTRDWLGGQWTMAAIPIPDQ